MTASSALRQTVHGTPGSDLIFVPPGYVHVMAAIIQLSSSVTPATFVAMIRPSEIERMSVGERLQTIELLWDSISRLGGVIESPAWHGEVLSARLARVDAGEGQFLSISELRNRLKAAP